MNIPEVDAGSRVRLMRLLGVEGKLVGRVAEQFARLRQVNLGVQEPMSTLLRRQLYSESRHRNHSTPSFSREAKADL